MKVKELLMGLEKVCPLALAAEWDNSGMQVGNLEDNVRGVYVSLDPTTESINQAASSGCNVLLTHHPLLFSPLKQVTNDNYIGRRVVKLLNNNMTCISMHTNFDVAIMGPLVAERFPYAGVETLDESGIGTIGNLSSPMSLKDLAQHIKKAFGLMSVNIYGNPGLEVRRLAIVPGSGHDDIDIAKAKRADVLVTGDITHHAGLDALEKGLCLIDAGHFGLEYVFIEYMAEKLKEILKGHYIGRADLRFPYHTV